MSGTITRINNDIIETYQGQDPQGDVGDSGVLSALADIVTNVKSYKATGDGVTDDTTAIQNAINATSSVGGGDVYLPSGSYAVSSTLNVPAKVRLLLNPNALIKATSDFGHVIRLRKDGRIEGGEISSASLSTFTHALIYLDGVDTFGTAGHNTAIKGVRFVGNNQQGYGIYMYASGNGNFISWVHGFDLVFENFNKAIYLQCVNGGSGNQWVNGNQFSKLGFNGNIWDIYLDGSKSIPNETSGNIFTDIQSEPTSNTQFFYISGNMNRIEGAMLWDVQRISSGFAGTLSANSQNTVINTSLNTGAISDNGSGNQIFCTSIQPFSKAVIPPVADSNSPVFLGNQDDYLAFANLRYTWTQTAGIATKGSNPITNVFNLSGDQSAIWDGSQTSSANPIVLELDLPVSAPYLSNLGFAFGPWNESPTYLKVERGNSGSWTTIAEYTGLPAKEYFVINNTGYPFDKLKFTLYGTNDTSANTQIRINRIFAQNTNSWGQAFLPMVGGKMLGTLNMGSQYLTVGNIASLPTASSTYRGQIVLVLGNGTSTADTFYICLMSSTATYSWKQVMAG